MGYNTTLPLILNYFILVLPVSGTFVYICVLLCAYLWSKIQQFCYFLNISSLFCQYQVHLSIFEYFLNISSLSCQYQVHLSIFVYLCMFIYGVKYNNSATSLLFHPCFASIRYICLYLCAYVCLSME